LLEHATLAVAGVPCDLFMLGDEVAVSLAGVVIVSGAPSVLDGLPGGNQSATAGTHGCYGVTHHTANGDVIVPTDIPSTGHGNTLGQAVAACKADADVLAHEYVPLPWGSCN
jgi:hypothetical protein